jgi:glycine C-acetyltransferase
MVTVGCRSGATDNHKVKNRHSRREKFACPLGGFAMHELLTTTLASSQPSEPTASPHLENFSLKDCISMRGTSLDDRIRAFGELAAHADIEGILYRRQVSSPTQRRVIIHDDLTGDDKQMVMFGSNNYLSLTTHPHVVSSVRNSIDRYGVGAGGPPLLNGTTPLHIEAEKRLARFKGVGDAILFSSGFLAQLGWITALIDKEDMVFFDEYSHASFFEGLKIANCKKLPFRHNDLDDLRRKLKKYKRNAASCWICVEGVYSMDGDLAPLDQIVEIAKEHGCRVAVDDAHGTGVVGGGKGTAHHFQVDPSDIDIHFGTFSKALGTVGGFVCAEEDLISYMRFMSRSHMFSAALPAPIVASVLAGLDVIEQETELIARLDANVQYFLRELNQLGIRADTQSAIIAILVPGRVNIRRMALDFHRRGVFINSVEYPAVPADKQRFRVSMMATHTKEDIDLLVRSFRELFVQYGIIEA